MLVTRDERNNESYYLMTTAEGDQANELMLPFVGDRVAVTGRLERHGDVLVLRAGAGDTRRR